MEYSDLDQLSKLIQHRGQVASAAMKSMGPGKSRGAPQTMQERFNPLNSQAEIFDDLAPRDDLVDFKARPR